MMDESQECHSAVLRLGTRGDAMGSTNVDYNNNSEIISSADTLTHQSTTNAEIVSLYGHLNF